MSDQDPQPPNADARDVPPPSALGLLVKVLLLPTFLVGIFIALWVTLRLTSATPPDVDTCVNRLSHGGEDRWRAAVDLAGLLQDPDHAALRSDAALARRLAAILQREIDAGRTSPDDLTLRTYLCRALGEFHVPDGFDLLIHAGATQRDPREIDVRRSAIEALAVRIDDLGPDTLPSGDRLLAMLLDASESPDAPLRATAAFTLGVLGGAEAQRRLVTLLGDPHADVRYNAATGLARHGNPQAVDVLIEMLDPDQAAGVEAEKQQAARDAKRRMILTNALRASGQLAAANPDAVSEPLRKAVTRLTDATIEAPVRVLAVDTLSQLARPAPADTD